MSRRFALRHLWPSGITGRLIAIFAVAIALSIGVSELVEWQHRYHAGDFELQSRDRQRILAIAALLQSSENHAEATLRTAINGPLLEITPTLSPGALDQPASQQLKGFQQELNQILSPPVAVQLQQNGPQHWQDYQQGQTELWPSRRRLAVTLRDRQGQWWQIILPQYGPEEPRFQGRKWFLILLAGISLWLGLSWITRRLTRPILRFAAAADRLGIDVNAPPLPEQGSRELKAATQAFNRMQIRLQRLIADRTLMLAAISHDLRTVLTRLRLRTEFIRDENQQIKAQSDLAQMEAMLTATIAFAKEENTPEAYTTLDLRSLVQSVCDDLSDAGHEVELLEGDSPRLTGQPMALRRAFSNLIENGAVYGQCATIAIEQRETNIQVAIADQGPGIPIEMQNKVLQPFFRLDPSRNRETGGTGLGLSVVHTIIQRHRGTLKFQHLWQGNAHCGFAVQVLLPNRD